MPQEFQVLRCFSCHTFQVHQVIKSPKWSCKLCGEKQSLIKVYGRGTGADCRHHVQHLNSLRGDLEVAALLNDTGSCHVNVPTVSVSEMDKCEGDVDDSQGASSRWQQYLPDSNETDVDGNTEIDAVNGYFTTDRRDFNHTKKSSKPNKRKSSNTNTESSRWEQFSDNHCKPVQDTPAIVHADNSQPNPVLKRRRMGEPYENNVSKSPDIAGDVLADDSQDTTDEYQSLVDIKDGTCNSPDIRKSVTYTTACNIPNPTSSKWDVFAASQESRDDSYCSVMNEKQDHPNNVATNKDSGIHGKWSKYIGATAKRYETTAKTDRVLQKTSPNSAKGNDSSLQSTQQSESANKNNLRDSKGPPVHLRNICNIPSQSKVVSDEESTCDVFNFRQSSVNKKFPISRLRQTTDNPISELQTPPNVIDGNSRPTVLLKATDVNNIQKGHAGIFSFGELDDEDLQL